LKGQSKTTPACLKIYGKLVEDENELLPVWQYLYTPKEAPDLDDDFKALVESKLTVDRLFIGQL
jgi:hypothetical protein